jgi:hypothetical protein
MAEDPRLTALTERMMKLSSDLTEGETLTDPDAALARAKHLYEEACDIDRKLDELMKQTPKQ